MAALPALLPMQSKPRASQSAHVPVPLHQTPAAGPDSPARGPPPRMAGSVQLGAGGSGLRWEEPSEAHALVTNGAAPAPGDGKTGGGHTGEEGGEDRWRQTSLLP